MKTALLVTCLVIISTIVVLSTSCAESLWSLKSPYGDVSTNGDGTATYTPPAVPITFPITRTK